MNYMFLPVSAGYVYRAGYVYEGQLCVYYFTIINYYHRLVCQTSWAVSGDYLDAFHLKIKDD